MKKSVAVVVSLTSALVIFGTSACSKKGAECKEIITAMNDLGTKLAETQKVTGANDAKPSQVAAALGPFSAAAKGVADTLNSHVPTVPELKQIAAEAATAATGLATAASQMTQYAGQMQNVDAAGKAVDDNKTVVDNAEAEIKKLCEAKPSQCTRLLKVMAAFPSAPQKKEDTKAIAAWTEKLNSWTADLAKVEIADATLKQQVENLDKGWKNFGAAMSQLVVTSDSASKYDESTKTFNGQIDQANKAIAAANTFCQ